jgi:T-complex protein 1 subunit alpha
MATLAINGERISGVDIRSQNVTACLSVSNIVKSSLGPLGLDKMLVDDIGDVVITNDGATILKRLDIEHPCARVLVELANLQDKEVGDGTTSVVIIAAELLRRANELVLQGIHPTSIISGYLKAKKEACKYIADYMTLKSEKLEYDTLLNCAKTCMSSKIIGKDSQFFAKMTIQAMMAVETINVEKKKKYPVKAVEILKVIGKSSHDSELINGYALEETRASQQMPKMIKNAKIALIDFDLRKMALKFGVQMLINNPNEIEKMREKEISTIKDRVDMLLDAGANVILTTKGIDDMALKYFVDRGCIAVRRIDKKKLRRIAQLTGGTLLITLADENGNESLPANSLGEAAIVEEHHVGDRELLFIKDCKSTKAQTIVLRGPNWYMLEELERSIHDCLCVIKRVLESQRVVPGGGAVETALSVYLESVAEQMSSRDRLAVQEFAQSLLIIPKTLAINGGYDSAELVSELRGYHAESQKHLIINDDYEKNSTQQLQKKTTTSNDKEDNKWLGLDLNDGKIRDRVTDGVLEPAMSKIKSIKFATEAAVTILRIDDAIKLNKKENPKGPEGHEH